MTLKKAQIVDEVHRYMFWDSRKKIFDVVETLLEIMKRTLASGDDVLISGLSEILWRVVTFKCSRQLRDRVNGIND